MKLKIVFVLLIALTSCSDKKDIPDGILSMQRMEAILSDLLIADALNTERAARDTSFKVQKENASYFLSIYKAHKTDSVQFNRSYAYYLKRPDLLKEISDTVIAVLNRNSIKPVIKADTTQKKSNGNNIKKTAR
ncbi:MAG: DUF4296 domain-containing protein [Lacibacter sp.]